MQGTIAHRVGLNGQWGREQIQAFSNDTLCFLLVKDTDYVISVVILTVFISGSMDTQASKHSFQLEPQPPIIVQAPTW